jgi:NAD(P)-dependent dehydrogenase (short-subunit alcohol dehydrogenase family)
LGASGGIGLAVVRLALEHGHSVRAFARSASRIGIEHSPLLRRTGNARSGRMRRMTTIQITAVPESIATGNAFGMRLAGLHSAQH